MIALICFVLAVLASPFKCRSRLAAENAALRHQLIVSAAKAAGRSRSRNQQRLHVCAAGHSGTRRLEVLSQFSLLDERARNNKGVLQAFSLPECDVEKSIAEIGPLGLVPAAERRMVGIGRSDDQHIGVRETRDEDS